MGVDFLKCDICNDTLHSDCFYADEVTMFFIETQKDFNKIKKSDSFDENKINHKKLDLENINICTKCVDINDIFEIQNDNDEYVYMYIVPPKYKLSEKEIMITKYCIEKRTDK